MNRLVSKKASDIVLLDASTRAAKGLLGPADGSAAMIDALHHAAHAAGTRNVQAAYDLLDQAGVVREPAFLAALEAVICSLPNPVCIADCAWKSTCHLCKRNSSKNPSTSPANIGGRSFFGSRSVPGAGT